jgi:hypothetical protein
MDSHEVSVSQSDRRSGTNNETKVVHTALARMNGAAVSRREAKVREERATDIDIVAVVEGGSGEKRTGVVVSGQRKLVEERVPVRLKF